MPGAASGSRRTRNALRDEAVVLDAIRATQGEWPGLRQIAVRAKIPRGSANAIFGRLQDKGLIINEQGVRKLTAKGTAQPRQDEQCSLARTGPETAPRAPQTLDRKAGTTPAPKGPGRTTDTHGAPPGEPEAAQPPATAPKETAPKAPTAPPAKPQRKTAEAKDPSESKLDERTRQITVVFDALERLNAPGRDIVHSLATLIAARAAPTTGGLSATASAEIARAMARAGLHSIEMTLHHEGTSGWTIGEIQVRRGDRMLDAKGIAPASGEARIARTAKTAAQRVIGTVSMPTAQVRSARLMIKRAIAPTTSDGPRIEMDLEINARLV